jgi:hypothetical protein
MSFPPYSKRRAGWAARSPSNQNPSIRGVALESLPVSSTKRGRGIERLRTGRLNKSSEDLFTLDILGRRRAGAKKLAVQGVECRLGQSANSRFNKKGTFSRELEWGHFQ